MSAESLPLSRLIQERSKRLCQQGNADGLRYVKFSTERQTKTRTGENTRNVTESKPKMFENPDLDNNDRCPVTAYLAYKQYRQPEMMADISPFYFAVDTEVPKAGKKWFKAAPLG